MADQEDNLFAAAIGKTSSPIRTPNTTGEFFFWLRSGVKLNPFDFVVAEQSDGSRTVGVVSEMYAVTDAESHLTNYIGSEFGDPQAAPYVDRVSSLTASARVLRNIRNDDAAELYTPLPSDRRVAFADTAAIGGALGFDQIRGTSIPAGVIRQSNGAQIPVFLDSDYVMGPEGAHVSASGISGLATKTSYVMFLLSAIYQRMGDRTAFIIFNVKHADLLHIDERADDMSVEDIAAFASLGLRPDPFQNVTYFLPRGNAGKPDSDNPPASHKIYAYSLEDVALRLDLLCAEIPDANFTIDAMVQFIRKHWAKGSVTFTDYTTGGGARRVPGLTQAQSIVRTWDELAEGNEQAMGGAVYNQNWHVTPARFKREIRRLTNHSMFVSRRAAGEVYLGDEIRNFLAPGRVTVIDIFRIPLQSQAFVIGDVMRSLENVYRETDPYQLPNLAIMIDELNTFAPYRGGEPGPVTEQIIEIARKGRARRTGLFGAQQFKSEVHPQVWGNATTHVVGRTGSAELRTAPYAELDESAKQSVLNLRQGELVVASKTWRTAIRISFPRPPYKRPQVRFGGSSEPTLPGGVSDHPHPLSG